METSQLAVAYTGDTEWTPALIPAASDADRFMAEVYFRDKMIFTHLSLNTIETNLDQLRPKRLELTWVKTPSTLTPDPTWRPLADFTTRAETGASTTLSMTAQATPQPAASNRLPQLGSSRR